MVDLKNTLYYLNREQEETHAQETAKKLGLPYIDLTGYPLVKEILDIIPEQTAMQYQVVPYLKIGTEVKVGLVSPKNKEALDYLAKQSGAMRVKFSPTLISRSSFLYGVMCYEKVRQKEEEARNNQEKAALSADEIKITDIQTAAEAAKRASTTQLLDTILVGGIQLNASDIHLEPREADFLTRYRVDGVLQDVVHLPLPQFKQLLSRIKFMSKLRMDITDQPQDGRFSFTGAGGESIDFRISLLPSAFGESVVMRLLGHEKSILTLDKLGFRPDALVAIREAIGKPHGMVLTSGPTGSGKSSTLYAVLMELKKPGVKIITLEDPVEYKIEGIEQSQVKSASGYGFAEGLRASLRQDPDILMVGEIRDTETAEIAVQAALTGHLLLSTIHANSAPAVYARLLEMGVKPFLLSGSINLIMAQRLVRKVCQFCKEEYQPNPDIWAAVVGSLRQSKLPLSKDVVDKLNMPVPKLIHGRGCLKCNSTGFTGRQVVVEVLVPNETIEGLIAKSASISEFEKAAAMMGMITMEQDGLMKALEGSTTIEEVWRVTRS